MKTTSLVALLIGSCIIYTGCDKGSSSKQNEDQSVPTTADASKQTAVISNTTTLQKSPEPLKSVPEPEKYEQVNPKELSFELKDFNYMATIGEAAQLTDINGHIGQLLCEGQSLQLNSNEIVKGLVDTKEYGKIKVAFANSVSEEAFTIYLTPTQKKALSALKAKK